jgi:DNA-binding SARP family transcriptional activator/tetratricopeptide (TPR) repeat protein
LLAYLALRPGQAHPREHLAALLWGEADEARARDSLRHALGALRSAVRGTRPPAFLAGRHAVALRPGSTVVDAVLFERLAAQGTPEALRRATRLYAGDLLEGLDGDDGPFREWLLVERARLHEVARSALGRLLAHQTRASAPEAAIQTASRLLGLDPADESAHRALMRIHASHGRRGAALRQYQLCVAVLARELGSEPEPETRALYRALLQSPASDGRASPDGQPAEHGAPGPAPLPLDCAPIVGRAAEVARLGAAFDAATRGGGQAVLIRGEAGIGKSRLVAELAREATRRGAHVLVGRSHESERILPLAPWAEALRAAGIGRDPRLLGDLGGPWRAELRRLLPEIDPSAPAPSPGRDPLRLFDVVARVVTLLAAARPVVIVLEDLHWADDLSVRLFAFLARRLVTLPVLLLATVREEETGAADLVGGVIEEVRREPHGAILGLAPLSRSDTITLVAALSPPGTGGDRLDHLGERVWRMSEGNPFVVTEAMRSVEAGDGSGAADRLRLPGRVRDLIVARLERSGEVARTVATVSAVFGGTFDLGLLCHATGRSEVEVADAVEELVRARVLHGTDAQLSFVHERIREAILERATAPRRAVLHRRVAESLEAADPDAHLGALATHYREGHAWPKAIEYLLRFADEAGRRYAVDEAVVALRDARQLTARLPPAERPRRRLEVTLRLAHSLYFLGRHDEGRRLLLAEREDLARTNEPSLAARYHFLLARSASLAGEHDEADRWAQATLDDAERAGDIATMGKARYLLAHEAYWTGRSGEGVEHAERAIALLQQAGDRWWLGHAWWILCVNFGFLGRFGPALEAARRTGEIGDALEDQRLRSYAAWSTGWILAACGKPDEGVEACRRAVELAPDPASRLNAHQALGYSWLEAGRGDRAIGELEPVVVELGRLAIRRPHGLFTACLAEAYRVAGRREQARAVAAGAAASTRALGYAYACGLALRTLGRLALDDSRPLEALDHLREACGAFTAIGARFEEARTRLDLGTTHRALDQRVDATRELDMARDTFEALEVPGYLERARRLAADAAPAGASPLPV